MTSWHCLALSWHGVTRRAGRGCLNLFEPVLTLTHCGLRLVATGQPRSSVGQGPLYVGDRT